ncbi:hypothetical protein MY3296_007433 [Beauveria thailandica]
MTDVDSITQSFLQEGEAAGARGALLATAQAYPQQQPLQQWFPQNSPFQTPRGMYTLHLRFPARCRWSLGWWVTHPVKVRRAPKLFPPCSNLSVQGVTPAALEGILSMGATTKPRMHTLPCVLMRAGTCKGLFIHRNDLLTHEKDSSPLLISALGSRGCDPRQIDGIGGGTSTTSKVALVFTVDAPQDRRRFYCWRLLLEEILLTSAEIVAIWCLVLDCLPFIVETVEIGQDGQFREDGEYNIPCVSTSGSEIKVAFVDPAGSMTDKLFPTGQRQLVLAVQARKHDDFKANVTLIDAAKPFLLINATTTSPLLQTCSPEEQDDLVEFIRITGAVQMGLARDTETASKTRGTPKAILLYPPVSSRKGADIRSLSY